MKALILCVGCFSFATAVLAEDVCDAYHDDIIARIEVFQKQSARLMDASEECTPNLAFTAQAVVDAGYRVIEKVEAQQGCELASIEKAVAHITAAIGYPKSLLEKCPLR